VRPVILIAEDETHIAEALQLNLELEGYFVLLARNGQQAIELYKEHARKINLAILDIMMPIHSGLEVCITIRKTNPLLPVLFLTAKNRQEDRNTGLREGADDYLTKPFDLEELLLRVKVLLRRSPSLKNVFEFKNGKINFETYEIQTFKGQTQSLSKREMALLELLTREANSVVSRDSILAQLWNDQDNASSRTIDNYILNFRKWFEPDPKNPTHFHSIRGVGYKFVP